MLRTRAQALGNLRASQGQSTLARGLLTQHQLIRGTLFGAEAAVEVLQFLDDTDVGKRMLGESDRDDWWDIERLDRSGHEEQIAAVIRGN